MQPEPQTPTSLSSEAAPAPTPEPQTHAAQADRGAPRFLSGMPNWLAFWLPIATSALSLVVAFAGFIAATQDPDVTLVLPREIRMGQGGPAPFLYVQPRFFSAGRNDRTDVITDIKIEVEAVEGGDKAEFVWLETGAFVYDPQTRQANYVYQADASPLVVSPSAPQYPLGYFRGPPDWLFKAGTYRMTITATRVVGKAPLSGTLTVTFVQEDMDWLSNTLGRSYGRFPVDAEPARSP